MRSSIHTVSKVSTEIANYISVPSSSLSVGDTLTSIELFAGTGGLALGTHLAGFRTLGLVEMDQFAVQTLRANSKALLNLHPDLVLDKDATKVDYKQFVNKVDLLSGGPPCQPFSMGGQKLGSDDPRNMFPVFLDAVSIILPKAVLIENVKGLLHKNLHEYYRYILKRLQFPLHRMRSSEHWRDHYQRLCSVSETDFADSEQYVVTSQLIDTADFGIPQRRERIIISAFRRDLGIDTFQISPTHSKTALLHEQLVSGAYWERHGIAPSTDHLSTRQKQLLELSKKKLIEVSDKLPWRTVRDALHDLPTAVARGVEPTILNHVQHPGARIYKSHIGSFWDYPAKALKAGTHGTPGGENMLRLSQSGDVRYFTTREAARLHTFPEEWHFRGTWGACIKQLGNAVPVELARLFAAEIRQRLLANLKLTAYEVNYVK